VTVLRNVSVAGCLRRGRLEANQQWNVWTAQTATAQERLIVKGKAGSPARLVKPTFPIRDNYARVRYQFQSTTCHIQHYPR
jgi:hypothetical protein